MSSPQAASRPCRPATPPCWAEQIRTCSRARSSRDWWINLGTALPWPASPGLPRGSARETTAPLGAQSVLKPPTPALQTPECLHALAWERVPWAREGRLRALEKKIKWCHPRACARLSSCCTPPRLLACPLVQLSAAVLTIVSMSQDGLSDPPKATRPVPAASRAGLWSPPVCLRGYGKAWPWPLPVWLTDSSQHYGHLPGANCSL